MVERNVGDDTEQRLDYIGGVETSAHANFEDGDLNFLEGKVSKGNGGHHFEKAGMPRQITPFNQLFGGAIDFAMQMRERFVADFLSVDANTLVDADEMRRGIESRP